MLLKYIIVIGKKGLFLESHPFSGWTSIRGLCFQISKSISVLCYDIKVVSYFVECNITDTNDGFKVRFIIKANF